MIRVFIAALAFLGLMVAPLWGQDAYEFYNRGLESSLAYKKVEYFSKAIQLDPNLAEAYEQRATHYYFQGKFDKARQDYTRAIALKPGDAVAYLMRGLSALEKAHPQGFMAELNRLALRYTNMGVPESRELLEKAIDDFSHAIDLNPELTAAYSYRAKTYLIMGLSNEALRDSTKAIELRGDQKSIAVAYNVRSRILRNLGQHNLSETDFRNSVELAPYSPDYPPLNVPLMLRYPNNTASPKTTSRIGLVGLIVLIFLLLFQITLRPPTKRD